MTTAGNLIDRIIQPLLAGTVEERNKIASSINSSETTLTMTYDLGTLAGRTVFEIEQELLYVWDSNLTGKTVTVERGYGGTTGASHSSGAVATVNPKFPRKQVLDALNSELADLSSPMNGLFQMKTVDLSYNGSDRMLNLTGVTNIIDLYEVRLRYMADDYPIIHNVRLMRDLPTSDFGAGIVLAFDDSVRSGTIRVLYKAPYETFTNESSTVASTGASTEMEDLLVMGAQIRLLAGREVKRNFIESQGDTRRSDEVPAGAMANSVANLLRLRRDRVTAEAARLHRQYPTRIRK